MSKELSDFLGGDGLPQLAPDLTSPLSPPRFVTVTSVNASAGLTTLINISGKSRIGSIIVTDLTPSTSYPFELTLDGTIVYSSTHTTAASGGDSNTITIRPDHRPILVKSSLLLKVNGAANSDTAVGATIEVDLLK